MIANHKRKAGIGIGVGLTIELGLELVAHALPSPLNPIALLIWIILGLLSALLLIWGCTNYAAAKRLPHWLGYLGFFSIVGPLVLWILPDRSERETQLQA